MLNNFCVFEELVFFDLWILDSGFRFPDSGFRIPDSGFRIPDSGFRIPDSGFRIPDSGFRVPDSGFRIPDSGFRFPIPESGFRFPGFRVAPWKRTKLDFMATFWAKIRYRDIVSELDFFKNQITNYPSLVSGRKIELCRLKF